MKKIVRLLFTAILFLSLLCQSVYASLSWPEGLSIASASGIVLDAKSGTVLYGKNMDERYYPASITKILTALIVLERCSLDEQITFSHNAVYNVEAGSSSAGYDVGDTLSVYDALHAMLIKSANEVANALAEHCAGSIEEFAVLMNEKAKSLGAVSSNFVNPSGLNDENHYTSAYDFALISAEAFKNPTLTEIAGKRYYQLPPSRHNPEGLTVYVHHAMLRKNSSNFYEYAKAGKTGYTSSAGNTLVTYAVQGDMHLITVVLGSQQTHYPDTRTLMEFGFQHFKSISLRNTALDYQKLITDMQLVGSDSTLKDLIYLDKTRYLTLPKTAGLEEASPQLSYELDAGAPATALAVIHYTLGDRSIGKTYLCSDRLASGNLPLASASQEEAISATASDTSPSLMDSLSRSIQKLRQNILLLTLLLVAALLALIFLILWILRLHSRRKSARYLEKIRSRRRGENSLEQPVKDELSIDFPKTPADYVRDMRSRKRKR